MKLDKAKQTESSLLAKLNHQLIRDEGHRNTMLVEQLTERMNAWLSENYEAYIFRLESEPIGYALFRSGIDYVYLRQFFVHSEFRRRGFGRSAFLWLSENVWGDALVRIDVLCANDIGIEFWRSLGFVDYCITMERGNHSEPS